jgi:hypothetical protein
MLKVETEVRPDGTESHWTALIDPGPSAFERAVADIELAREQTEERGVAKLLIIGAGTVERSSAARHMCLLTCGHPGIIGGCS